MRASRIAWMSVVSAAAAVGSVGCGEEGDAPPPLGQWVAPVTVETVAMERCDTPPELVVGLSQQLVDAINCLRPGTLADIPLGADITMLRAGRPAIIDGRAVDALADAAAAGDRQMVVRWAYRDVALQHLFWLQDQFRGCAVAAPAGLSNHQNGLAVDLDDRAYWEPLMRAEGWANDLPNDRVHFDYQSVPDVGLGALSLLAFQALWNENVPDEPLRLTAELDGDTYDALSRAPIEGFARGLCDGGAPPVGPGPVRGPTLGQQAWRGCQPPAELVEGLAAQVTRGMACVEPDAVAALPLCVEPGCVQVIAPPVVEVLGAAALDALIEASLDVGAPLVVEEALRDAAMARFYDATASNIGCTPPGGGRELVTGRAVRLAANGDAAGALIGAGFVEVSPRLWVYEGADAADLDALSVLAFQRLWNLNRPDDPIDEDGLIGPQTRGALDRAPIAGWADEPCGVVAPDMGPTPDMGAPDDMGVEPDAGGGVDAGVEPDVGGAGGEGGEGGEGGGAGGQGGVGGEGGQGGFGGAGGFGGQGGVGGQGGAAPDARVPPAPVPGWSGLTPEDEAGCDTTPGAPGGATGLLGVLLVALGARRRR